MKKICKNCENEFEGPTKRLFCGQQCFNEYRIKSGKIKKENESADFLNLTIRQIEIKYTELLNINSKLKSDIKILEDKLEAAKNILCSKETKPAPINPPVVYERKFCLEGGQVGDIKIISKEEVNGIIKPVNVSA